mgnify:CR=1 FL=1
MEHQDLHHIQRMKSNDFKIMLARGTVKIIVAMTMVFVSFKIDTIQDIRRYLRGNRLNIIIVFLLSGTLLTFQAIYDMYYNQNSRKNKIMKFIIDHMHQRDSFSQDEFNKFSFADNDTKLQMITKLFNRKLVQDHDFTTNLSSILYKL